MTMSWIDDFLFLCRRDQKYNHCRIHTKAEGGRTKYYLIENVCFDSIFDLIEHYRVSGRGIGYTYCTCLIQLHVRSPPIFFLHVQP